MTPYGKLVRDRFPEIIQANGETAVTQSLATDERIPALRAKLAEVVAEYAVDGAIEELADVAEVVRALVAAHGLTWDGFEAIREAKRAERGGFDDGVFLVETRSA